MTLGNLIWHLKFVQKKPQIIPRIVKDLFCVRVLKKPRLRTVDFAITYKCNGRCPMCSAKELMQKKGEELAPNEIIEVMRQARDLGAIHMNLTGGEPTMRKRDDLAYIIHEVNDLSMLVSLVTNCIDFSWRDLAYYKNCGLDAIQLSLESMNPETHDKIRNAEGNWLKLIELFYMAQMLHLNIVLSTVLTKDNFDEVQEIIEFSKQQKVFTLLNPISHYPELSICDKKAEYYDLLKDGNVRADTIVNFRGGSGCPAGIERIYITPYGDVMTCPHVHLNYGNVRQEPLAGIYDRICDDPWLSIYERDCRHIWNDDYMAHVASMRRA